MPKEPKARFDGGSLDCGSGLLLLIRKHIDPLLPGEVLEFTSTEASVEVDLPSWCNLTGNPFLTSSKRDGAFIFHIEKGGEITRSEDSAQGEKPSSLPIAFRRYPSVPECAVMGIGSWPRPKWMLRAIHERLSARLGDEEFEDTAQDAVRMAVEAQIRAGVSVVTDGEQRRDSYSAFVGASIENCQLIPLLDVLPYVDDPEEFRKELLSLDIPAGEVRHPMVFGPLRRKRPLAVPEAEFLMTLTELPIKVALPGPYLLTRMMWMDCVVDRAYSSRDALAADIVSILRDEVAELLQCGVSLVQLDEPVLTEVAFGHSVKRRSFMCGILGEKKSTDAELRFAAGLLQQTLAGFRRERIGLHLCRGNWTPDEQHALSGSYEALIATLNEIPAGIFFLEAATDRAGSLEALQTLRPDAKIGIGVANQKRPDESIDTIRARVKQACETFGRERLFFTPDCGFATFADNPIASAEQSEKILQNIVQAVRAL